MSEQTSLGFDMTPRPVEPLALPPAHRHRDENSRRLYPCRRVGGSSCYRPHFVKPGGRADNGWSLDVSFWGPWKPWKYSSGKLMDGKRGRLLKPWLLAPSCLDPEGSPMVGFTYAFRGRVCHSRTRLALKACHLPGGQTVDMTQGWHAYAWQMLLARKDIVGGNSR